MKNSRPLVIYIVPARSTVTFDQNEYIGIYQNALEVPVKVTVELITKSVKLRGQSNEKTTNKKRFKLTQTRT